MSLNMNYDKNNSKITMCTTRWPSAYHRGTQWYAYYQLKTLSQKTRIFRHTTVKQ